MLCFLLLPVQQELGATAPPWTHRGFPGTPAVQSLPRAGDFDGDGAADAAILLSYSVSFGLVWLRNVDGRGGVWNERVIVPDTDSLGNLTLADLDNDGNLDIIVSDFPSTRLYRNTAGNGSVWTDVAMASDGGDGDFCLEPADIDQDGDLDLVRCRAFGGLDWLQSNERLEWERKPIAPDFFWVGMEVADDDLDGDADVHSNGVTFENLRRGALWAQRDAEYFGTHDLDGDGDLDAIIRSPFGWAENLRPGEDLFQEHVIDPSSAFLPRVGDMDFDGDLDIVVAPQLWENLGGRLLRWGETSIFPPFTSRFDLGDVDADGDLDILAGSLTVFYNGAIAD